MAGVDVVDRDPRPRGCVPDVFANGLEEVGIAAGDGEGLFDGFLIPLDAAFLRRPDQRSSGGGVKQQADGRVVVEPFRVADGVRELRWQRGQAGPDEGDSTWLGILAQLVDRGVDRDELPC